MSHYEGIHPWAITGSAIGNAVASKLPRRMILIAIQDSPNAETFDIAIDAAIRLNDIINKERQMRRTVFQDPRPASYSEIMMAFAEREATGSEVVAQVEYVDDDGFGAAGWTAEVFRADNAEEVFITRAHDDRDELLGHLRDAGIPDAVITIGSEDDL